MKIKNLVNTKVMVTKDDAIAYALDAAMVEYETNNIVLVNAEFDSENNYWLVTFEVWEWFKCVWRVWERDDGTACYAFFKELRNKQEIKKACLLLNAYLQAF